MYHGDPATGERYQYSAGRCRLLRSDTVRDDGHGAVGEECQPPDCEEHLQVLSQTDCLHSTLTDLSRDTARHIDRASAPYSTELLLVAAVAASYFTEILYCRHSRRNGDSRFRSIARPPDAGSSAGTIMDWKARTRLIATNVLLFAALFLLVTFNKEYLRPAFWHTPVIGILTGSLPNFLAAFLLSLAVVNGVNSRKPERGRPIVYVGSSLVFLVLTVEELRPMWGASTQYDLYDIVASGLGSLTAILVFELITRKALSTRCGSA